MNIAVYCAASQSNCPSFDEKTEELGNWIAKKNYTLVYGGGNTGLMGVIATSVMMSERKNKMIELSEVYIALPGGPGTLEEIAEVVSWVRVGQTNGICIFYNMEGYYDHLESFFNHMVMTNLLSKEDRNQIHFAKSLEEIEKLIENYEKR